MSFTTLIAVRRLCTSRSLLRPALSANYKSQSIWNERLSCNLLSNDEHMVKNINNKILSNNSLNHLELDIFLNITTPRTDDVVHLQESARLIRNFRKSLLSHLLLPSSSHATCRVFLYSNQLHSLTALLEDRVNYGIFPDYIITNILLDAAIEREDFSLASRIAALVMFQEDFGCNKITDALSLYSLSSYSETLPDFTSFKVNDLSADIILNPQESMLSEDGETGAETKSQDDTADADVEEEDENDAEYIRVPWLRNPYFDDHFDIKDPRVICGRTLLALSRAYMNSDLELSLKSSLLGNVLSGKWQDAIQVSKQCETSSIKLGPMTKVLEHFINNLHGLESPGNQSMESLSSSIKKLEGESESLSVLVDKRFESQHQEDLDIDQLKKNLSAWSRLRQEALTRLREQEEKKRIVDEIKRKKEDLKRKEQFLYFYDNLKKSSLTRIEYD